MKKTFTRWSIAAAFTAAACGNAAAQDIHFSQFYENAMLRNPALTGIFSGDYKAGVNYRSQWGNIANPFQTVLASVESRKMVNPEAGDYISFGLTTSYDHAGSISFNSLQIMPAVNYNKSLEDAHQSYISVGFAGGYIQRSVDMSRMTLDNQYVNGGYSANNSSGENMVYTKLDHWDLSAGVSLNSAAGENNAVTYYLGAAAYHVTKPKQAFNGSEQFIRLSTRWTGNAGFTARIGKQFGVIAHANYQNQKPYKEFIFGGLVNWHPDYSNTPPDVKRFNLYVGVFHRIKDAIIPTLKVNYDTYDFTVSYDVTTSTLRPTSMAGGWEFSVFTRGLLRSGPLKSDPLKCPRFEMLQGPNW